MTEWRRQNLGAVVKAGGGRIQTGPFGSQLHASDYVECGVPCIMPANMKDNRVDLSEIAQISVADANRLKRHIVQSGDLIYSRRGDVTQKALIREQESGFFCGTGCLLIRPGSKIDSAFLTYYLSTRTYQNWIVRQAVGATMPNLNTGILANVSFQAPDKEEQAKIAHVLSTLDAKIELNHRINQELEGLAKLLYDYWFVQFDFPISAEQAAAMGDPTLQGKPYRQSGGKMTYNPTLKREIPEGWEVGLVSDFCGLNLKVWQKKSYPDLVEYVDLANTKSGRIVEISKLAKEDAPSRAQRILTAGDTIVGVVRPENRSYAWVPDDGRTLTASTGFAVLTPTKREFREFNYLALTSDLNVLRLSTIASGAAYPAVNPEIVADLRIAKPPATLLHSFSKIIAPSFNLIEKHQKQNQELATLRDWLLPMLMNGQVTVGENH